MSKVNVLRSDAVYRKMMDAPPEKRSDIYRYELMLPFEKKWACYNVPLRPAKPGGYDVVMASEMLGILSPRKVDDSWRQPVALLTDALWRDCQQAVEGGLRRFTQAGIDLSVEEYLFTLLLAEPESAYIKAGDGYCGDGGIPGYITGCLVPGDETIRRMPVALAHETDHNVRFQFIRWSPNVTLGDMLVCEGLAENFATAMFGEELVGPWVTKTDKEWLNEYIKPTLREALGVQGLAELNAYLYGDELAALQGYPPAGLPCCAGYACGYYLIKHYLKKTGKSIEEATILPSAEILAAAADFWDTVT